MNGIRYFVAVWVVIGLITATQTLQADNSKDHADLSSEVIPFKDDNIVTEKKLIKVAIVSILGVLVAIVVLASLKKFLIKLPVATGVEDRVRLQNIKKLSPKLTLMIARVDDKEYLISQSGDRVTIVQHREIEQVKDDIDEL